jgi:hypothetical protein
MFELQSNASLAVQKEVMRTKPDNVRRGSVKIGVWAAYGSSPGLGPRAIEDGPMRQSLKATGLSASDCKRRRARGRKQRMVICDFAL